MSHLNTFHKLYNPNLSTFSPCVFVASKNRVKRICSNKIKKLLQHLCLLEGKVDSGKCAINSKRHISCLLSCPSTRDIAFDENMRQYF